MNKKTAVVVSFMLILTLNLNPSSPGLSTKEIHLPERIEEINDITRVLYESEEYQELRKSPIPTLTDEQWNQYRQKIVNRESGGNWKAINNESDKCYGLFQIQASNIKRFTGLTPDQFLSDTIAQERLFVKLNNFHYSILSKYENNNIDSLLFRAFTRGIGKVKRDLKRYEKKM